VFNIVQIIEEGMSLVYLPIMLFVSDMEFLYVFVQRHNVTVSNIVSVSMSMKGSVR